MRKEKRRGRERENEGVRYAYMHIYKCIFVYICMCVYVCEVLKWAIEKKMR